MVYGTMSMEVLKQRREELMREAELARLKMALRANRGRPATPRWVSTVAWELARAAGLLRKYFRTPEKGD
jgi:hypothetical protein